MKRSQLLGSALIATFALTAAAYAQEADPTNDTIEAISTPVAITEGAAACSEMMARYKQATKLAEQWQRAGSSLSRISLPLAALSIAGEVQAGRNLEAAQQAGELGTSAAICAASAHACAGWNAGQAVGKAISAIPLLFGGDRTLNDMWTDTLAGWVYGTGEPTAAEIEQMIARHRQKLQELQAAAKPPPPMCKVEEAKDAVAEMLEKAKARTAGQLTLSVPTDLDSLTANAVTSAETAGSTASSAATQAIQQQQAMQHYSGQMSSSSSSDVGSDPCPALRQKYAEVRQEAVQIDAVQEFDEGVAEADKRAGELAGVPITLLQQCGIR